MSVDHIEAREHLNSLRALLHEHSDDWIATMEAVAGDDDELRLRMVAAHLALVDEHATRMRDYRDAAAVRLRDAGVPMTRIARWANIDDSALSRRLRGLAKRGGLIAVGLIGVGTALAELLANLVNDPAVSAALTVLPVGS